MSNQKLSSTYFMEQWETYCAAVTGAVLPLNFMHHTDEETVIGYLCAGDNAIECANGRTIRLITMTVPNIKEIYEWQ